VSGDAKYRSIVAPPARRRRVEREPRQASGRVRARRSALPVA